MKQDEALTGSILTQFLCSSEMALRENTGAIYFTVIIPTIITAPSNNDFLCWQRSGWRGV